jgi:predicted RNase H-like nuclease (RuvC/YqgF family)
MNNEKKAEIRMSEAKAWLKELKEENNKLEQELDAMEVKVERLQTRYELAEKTYRRSSMEIIKENNVTPLNESLQALRKEYEEKQVDNNQKIIANEKLIENIEAVIKVKSQ